MMFYVPNRWKVCRRGSSINCRLSGQQKEKIMYTDTAPELIAAISRLDLKHNPSTPYRSIANSIVERSIRTVREGTRTLLEQSGFPVQWWPYASRCFCHSMNTAVVDGDCVYNKRHGVEFDGFSIP